MARRSRLFSLSALTRAYQRNLKAFARAARPVRAKARLRRAGRCLRQRCQPGARPASPCPLAESGSVALHPGLRARGATTFTSRQGWC